MREKTIAQVQAGVCRRLIYESAKHGPGGSGRLLLTPLELIERRAARVPPPR